MLIGPFNDKVASPENIPLLGPSSQILASILSKNLNASQMIGKPTSSFWHLPSNSGARFYDSMGYPIDDFVSPSHCLAYGDPKGKEFIRKILRMAQSDQGNSNVAPLWLSSILSKLTDDMTMGGHSFIESISTFKDSMDKSISQRNNRDKAPDVNISNNGSSEDAEPSGSPSISQHSTHDFSASNPHATNQTITHNDRLLLEISSLLIKMNSIKSQLVASHPMDPTLTTELGSVSSEIKGKLAKIAKQCSPENLMGPRYFV